ncbi:hypothetical protein Pcinc_013364 [Petrolisthes cinctipes]|uniref:Uncharacterized protein n=1 Tax=Petrolisthes cinctipes TaxID=88211 RepID=A0AAE1FYT4_PETCI|nr:hypothetical protein Pcinc_013364 [Petrolisthes cinctipes]
MGVTVGKETRTVANTVCVALRVPVTVCPATLDQTVQLTCYSSLAPPEEETASMVVEKRQKQPETHLTPDQELEVADF